VSEKTIEYLLVNDRYDPSNIPVHRCCEKCITTDTCARVS